MTPETIDQYKIRILSNTEGKDPVEVQRQTPQSLLSLIKGRDADSLRRNPHPGRWSVAQIVTHLAQSEVVATSRYRQMLESSGSKILPYDQSTVDNLVAY